ncbi:MAG: Imm74 family immunity protein [Acidobacteriota bacterium]
MSILLKIRRTLRLGLGGAETRIDGSSHLIRLGRDEYQFVEGARRVNVYIEMLSGTPDRMLDRSSIDRWLPPHEREDIDETERERIAGKISEFLNRQGHSVEIR